MNSVTIPVVNSEEKKAHHSIKTNDSRRTFGTFGLAEETFGALGLTEKTFGTLGLTEKTFGTLGLAATFRFTKEPTRT